MEVSSTTGKSVNSYEQTRRQPSYEILLIIRRLGLRCERFSAESAEEDFRIKERGSNEALVSKAEGDLDVNNTIILTRVLGKDL
jgi:hypothetical protein